MAAAKRPATRKDPEPRFLGVMPFFDLVNEDPSRKYVWVSKTTAEHLPGGRGWYELSGYRYEEASEGGVRARGVKTASGSVIEVGDQLLMSADRADYAERTAAAQRAADVRERQMIKKTGKYDPMRGLGNMNNRYGDPYVMAKVDVDPLRYERGGLIDG